MQVVILAGGQGTRLRGVLPLGMPKPMAPVSGRPFLLYLLDQAISSGASSFLILLGYGAEVIESAIGTSYRSIGVTYSREQVALGTGGAVVCARSLLEERFVLLNGDTFSAAPLRELITLLDFGLLSLTVVALEDCERYGRVRVRDDVVVSFEPKGAASPGLINAGAYGCRRELLDLMPAAGKFSLEADFLGPQLTRLRPRFVEADGCFLDIGVPSDYEAAQRMFGGVDGGRLFGGRPLGG